TEPLTIPLTPRRAQILAAITEAGPAGISASQLSRTLYGDADHLVTVRAEVSRLRRSIGALLATRPYRWAERVHAQSDDSASPRGRRAGRRGGRRRLPRSSAPPAAAPTAVPDPNAQDRPCRSGLGIALHTSAATSSETPSPKSSVSTREKSAASAIVLSRRSGVEP